MICPYCQADNREGARYCDECGLPLTGMIAQMAAMADGPSDPAARRAPAPAASETNAPDAAAADGPVDFASSAPASESEAAASASAAPASEPPSVPEAPAACDDAPPIDDPFEAEAAPAVAPAVDMPAPTPIAPEALPDIMVEGVNADEGGIPFDASLMEDDAGAYDDYARGSSGAFEAFEAPAPEDVPQDAAAPEATTPDAFAGDWTGSPALAPDDEPAPIPSWRSGDTGRMPAVDERSGDARRDYRAESTVRRRAPWKAAVLAVLAVAVVGAAVLGSAYSLELWGGKTVPSVVGRTQTDAVSMLEQKGFQVSVTEVKSDEAQGVVLSVSPAAGSKTESGAEVEIEVAVSRSVPKVEGLQRDEALSLLSEEGLDSVTVQTAGSDEHTGTVLSVEPEAGTRVTAETEVTLTVAVPYTVPDVAGLSLEDAQEALEEEGYEVEVAYTYADDGDGQTVVSTSPEAGEELSAGSTVTVTVALPRADEAESIAYSYLAGLGTVTLGDVSYQIDSVDGVSYKGDGVLAFTITARAYTTIAGELAYTESQQVNGTITFNDDNSIASVF